MLLFKANYSNALRAMNYYFLFHRNIWKIWKPDKVLRLGKTLLSPNYPLEIFDSLKYEYILTQYVNSMLRLKRSSRMYSASLWSGWCEWCRDYRERNSIWPPNCEVGLYYGHFPCVRLFPSGSLVHEGCILSAHAYLSENFGKGKRTVADSNRNLRTR